MAQYAPAMAWAHAQAQAQAGFQMQQQLQQQLLWQQHAMLGGGMNCAPHAMGTWPLDVQRIATQSQLSGSWPQVQPSSAQDPAVAALMEDLGIQPSELDDFAWIAEYGANDEVLPPPWTKHLDLATGNVYYVDSDSQASSWESPLLPCLRRVLQAGRFYLAKPCQDFFEQRKVLLWKQLKEDLDGWYGPLESPDGRPYYANSQTGESSWRDPRVDTQQLFELESGLLDALGDALPPPEELEVPGFGGRESTRAAEESEKALWRTDSGAEVLTLEPALQVAAVNHPPQAVAQVAQQPAVPEAGKLSSSPVTPRTRNRLSAAALKDTVAEQKSTLKSMLAALAWIDEVVQVETDLQRKQIHLKAKARASRLGIGGGT